VPASYQLRPDGTLVITAHGVMTAGDLAHLRSEWKEDRRLLAVVSTLFDGRAITSFEIPTDVIREYANTRGDVPHMQNANSRVAIVATSDVGFGLARMYAQSGWVFGEIAVFRTVEEADAWLAAGRVRTEPPD
jgi:hypothetical protein